MINSVFRVLSKRSKFQPAWLLLTMAAFLFGQSALAQREPIADATISLSADDYPPGYPADMWGSGFAPGETVTLQVLHADGTPDSGFDHLPWDVLQTAKVNLRPLG